MIKQLNINDNDISKNDYQSILENLDINHDGVVSIEEFLLSISSNKKIHEKFSNFLKKVNDQLLTNSEIMMKKLKDLKKRAAFTHDKQSLDDLDW